MSIEYEELRRLFLAYRRKHGTSAAEALLFQVAGVTALEDVPGAKQDELAKRLKDGAQQVKQTKRQPVTLDGLIQRSRKAGGHLRVLGRE